MKSQLLIALDWLWSTKGRNLWLLPSVLTSANAQDKTAPQMSMAEARSVFKYLEDRNLIFPIRTEAGHVAYQLHELNVAEWEEALSELKKPKWKQSKVLKMAGKCVVGFVVLVFTGFVGAYSGKVVDDFYDARKAKDAGSNVVSQAASKQKTINTNENHSRSPAHTPNNITNK